MLSLHNSTWNVIPFRAKHKDKFLLLASDIGKVNVNYKLIQKAMFFLPSLDNWFNYFSCR